MDATTAITVLSVVAAVAIFAYLALTPPSSSDSKAKMSAAAPKPAAAAAPAARPELKDFTIKGACQPVAGVCAPPSRGLDFTTAGCSRHVTAAARAPAFCPAELAEYNGTDASKPVLLAADGFVFDVSAGRAFYGPGGPYGGMAGR